MGPFVSGELGLLIKITLFGLVTFAAFAAGAELAVVTSCAIRIFCLYVKRSAERHPLTGDEDDQAVR